MTQEHNSQPQKTAQNKKPQEQDKLSAAPDGKAGKPKEIGGRKGPEPTRYGDWELGGKCVDF